MSHKYEIWYHVAISLFPVLHFTFPHLPYGKAGRSSSRLPCMQCDVMWCSVNLLVYTYTAGYHFVTVTNWMSFHWVFWSCVQWNQPFVKDWAHACYEIHKKWWVYTAGLHGPCLKKCSMILNAAMQSKYLQIDTHYLSRSDMCSITTFEAPYLWTSVNGWAHTCCIDAWISN